MPNDRMRFSVCEPERAKSRDGLQPLLLCGSLMPKMPLIEDLTTQPVPPSSTDPAQNLFRIRSVGFDGQWQKLTFGKNFVVVLSPDDEATTVQRDVRMDGQA